MVCLTDGIAALACVAFACVVLACVAFVCVALACVALVCVAFACVTFACVALACVAIWLGVVAGEHEEASHATKRSGALAYRRRECRRRAQRSK